MYVHVYIIHGEFLSSGISLSNHPFLIGFSIINHPFGGTPMQGNPHICIINYIYSHKVTMVDDTSIGSYTSVSGFIFTP